MSSMTMVYAVVGYFCGSIPSGVLFARMRGVDLRKVGSGNIGATNTARALGKKIGAVVLVLDSLKAVVPLIIVRTYFAHDPLTLAVLGVSAVLGHMFSLWLKGRGGKGVATGLGVFLVLSPASAGIAVAIWILLYVLTRTSSIGSLGATTALLPVLYFRHEPREYLFAGLVLYLLILWKHRENITRLLQRRETKV